MASPPTSSRGCDAVVSKKKSRKKAAKKKVAKRPSTRKAPVRRKPAKAPAKKKSKKKKVSRAPSGYRKNPLGEVLIPDLDSIDTVVAPSKIMGGFEQAQKEIKNLLNSMTEFAEDYEVAEISLSVSFSADGKFLGFGVGGATSMMIKLTPGEQDS